MFYLKHASKILISTLVGFIFYFNPLSHGLIIWLFTILHTLKIRFYTIILILSISYQLYYGIH